MHDHHGWPSGLLKYTKTCNKDYKATFNNWGSSYKDGYYYDGYGNKY